MKSIIVVVKNGRVEQVYSNDKNIDVEVIDMDSQNIEDLEYSELRLNEIKNRGNYHIL